MYAAIFNVTIKDRDAAEAGLREQVVPSAKSAPGFVAGYGLDRGDDRGMAVVLFDSQENARAWVDGGAPPPEELPVTRDSSEVVEVVASA